MYKKELLELLGPEEENETQDNNTTTAGTTTATQTMTNLFSGNTRTGESPVMTVFTRIINISPLNLGGPTLLERINNFSSFEREAQLPLGSQDSAHSLIELLDGIILFYYAVAKTQIANVAILRDEMMDYVGAMTDLQSRLKIVKNTNDDESRAMERQLIKTVEILEKRLTEQARQMAWVRAVIFSKEKQERLAWLLKIVIMTLSEASESGKLFSFVPDFYLDALADLVISLKNHFHPTTPIEKINEFDVLLKTVAQFLCDHFLDHRIVSAHSKDTLITSLAGFASNRMTLEALENVVRESRIKVVTNLLKSYENRAWAPSNWILVRFWQGHGFAFHNDKSPHLSNKIGPRILTQESLSSFISANRVHIYVYNNDNVSFLILYIIFFFQNHVHL